MSELSERSGVPVATVKYYLREGLLPAGEAVGATRAVYDESHVRRLRLIRALVDIAGLGLDRVRDVLDAVDDDATDLMTAIGAAHMQLSSPPATEPTAESRERVAGLVRLKRWHTDPAASHATALAAALDTAALAGQPMSDATLEVYATAAADVARRDLSTTPRHDAQDATAYAVIGTLVNEPILISLRRMAHEHLARRRLARNG